VFGDLVIAVNIGVLLACLLFMKRMSEAIVIEQHTHEKLRLETDNKDFKLPPKTVVFAIEGPFFFGAAQHLDHALESIHGHAEILVLRLAKVPFIDATAMQSLWDLLATCQRHNTRLVLCEARPNVIQKLKTAGLIDKIGKDNMLEHIHQINRYEPTR
jgi:SulP family sulfate permease